MAIHFSFTSKFEECRQKFEQHLYGSVLEIEQNEDLAIRSVDQFAKSIDHLLDTLEQIYQTPGTEESIGEKSFPIRDGRYRVFFKVTLINSGDFVIVFLDIDDNKQSNLDRFPVHKIITFDDEN